MEWTRSTEWLAVEILSRAVIGAGVLTLVLAAGSLILSRQARVVVVDRVTIVNPAAYRLQVELSSARSDRGVVLGDVQPQADAPFRNVPDHGELWVFAFLHAGKEVDVVPLRHEQLTRLAGGSPSR